MVSGCPGCSTDGRGAGRSPCPRPWGPSEAAAAARPGFPGVPGGQVARELSTWSPGELRPWAGLQQRRPLHSCPAPPAPGPQTPRVHRRGSGRTRKPLCGLRTVVLVQTCQRIRIQEGGRS